MLEGGGVFCVCTLYAQWSRLQDLMSEGVRTGCTEERLSPVG